MEFLKEVNLDRAEINNLKNWVQSLDDVTPFQKEPRKSALVVSYSMVCEIGGLNDNLALHINDSATGKKIVRSSLRGVLVDFDGAVGMSVTSADTEKIETRIPGFNKFIYETKNGFILFPQFAASHLIEESIEPVLVKKWLLNTTFAPSDPKTHFYKDDMWEIIENDAYIYASIVSKKQMVLQGLHDLVDHAASAKSEGWVCASEIATEMHQKFSEYFQRRPQGNIPSHLIPFATGVLLDELTQMPHYQSKGRIAAIRLLLKKMDSLKIDPFASLKISDFPTSIDNVTNAARVYNDAQDLDLIRFSIDQYADDVSKLTYK
ncbi:MAG: hypothetical protein WCI18_16730 [Pseudomonadota bacterium]